MISLLPKKGTFFALFRAQGAVIRKGTDLFAEFARNFGDFEAYCVRAKNVEREGDEVVHRLTVELAGTFNTPLDREDIHPLMLELDKITNLINRAVQEVFMYGIVEKPAVMDEFVPLMQSAAEHLERLLVVFEQRKYVPELAHAVEKIRGIETAADQLYKRNIHALFAGDPDGDPTTALRVLKTSRFVTNLEKIVDAFQTAANHVEGIAIKWS